PARRWGMAGREPLPRQWQDEPAAADEECGGDERSPDAEPARDAPDDDRRQENGDTMAGAGRSYDHRGEMQIAHHVDDRERVQDGGEEVEDCRCDDDRAEQGMP